MNPYIHIHSTALMVSQHVEPCPNQENEMQRKELAELTDQELLVEAKKMKPTSLYDAVIIGALVGIAIYSAVKNGLGFLTFLPLIYLPIAAKNKTKNKEVQKLLKDRKLI